MKKLEKQTGFAVLERRGRGVLLTERGQALAAYGRRILAELEELQSTLLADPAKPSGHLKIVSFSTACRGLVGPALGKLAVFSGVWEFPVRVKCASLPWHTLKAALDGDDRRVSTEVSESSSGDAGGHAR